MTMMASTTLAMDMCISHCCGKMPMSMLLGAIMTVMVIKYMDHKFEDGMGQGEENLPETHGG